MADKSASKSAPGPNDDLIPLLIASNQTGLALNYNRMAALDPHGRTYAALEHKFRKFKARAKEILDAEGTGEGNGGAGKAEAKKRKTRGDAVQNGSDGGEATASKKSKATKKALAKGKAEAQIAKNGTTTKAGIKDENLDDDASPTIAKKAHVDSIASGKESDGKSSDEEGEGAKLVANVAKKRDASAVRPKAQRKGVARVVKKQPVLPREDSGEDTEESGQGEEHEESFQPKPKPKPKKGKATSRAAAKPVAKGKGKKGKSAEEPAEDLAEDSTGDLAKEAEAEMSAE